MKRVFKFKKGIYWEGEEDIFNFLDDVLTDFDENELPVIKDNFKVTVIVEKK